MKVSCVLSYKTCCSEYVKLCGTIKLIISMFQARVSLKRLEKFLNSDELDCGSVDRTSNSGPAVQIENGTFTWDKNDVPLLKE